MTCRAGPAGTTWPSPPWPTAVCKLMPPAPDPFIVQNEPFAVPVDKRCFVAVEMASDQSGKLEVFWATQADVAAQPKGAYPFTGTRMLSVDVTAAAEPGSTAWLPIGTARWPTSASIFPKKRRSGSIRSAWCGCLRGTS